MTQIKTFTLIGLLWLAGPGLAQRSEQPDPVSYVGPCERSASAMYQAQRDELYSDYNHRLAVIANMPGLEQRRAALSASSLELQEGLAEARVRFELRRDLCVRLGGGAYHPLIAPDEFVATIDNPYMPFVVGRVMTYHKHTSEGLEVTEVTYTSQTREILGVTCSLRIDRSYADDELEAITHEYLAQDKQGNVWLFAELSTQYEEGLLVGSEGSWVAGRDDAHPGILMLGTPAIGRSYRNAFQLGVAEDVSTVLALGVQAETQYANFVNCLETNDQDPLEPGEYEFKIYAPGFGFVIEFDFNSGEMTELVEIQD